MNDHIAKTVERIRLIFPRGDSPRVEWQSFETVKNFVDHFGNEFFTEFWPHMYEDPLVTRYLFPLLMEYFLTSFSHDKESNAADYFLGTLDPVVQREVQMDHAVEQFSASLTEEQRKVVCEWLNQLGEKGMLLDLEGAKTFWCGYSTIESKP